MTITEIITIKLTADEGKMIASKTTHWDEEQQKEVYDVYAKEVYLSSLDSKDNYIEVDEEE